MTDFRVDHKKTFSLIALYILVGIVAGVAAIIFQQLMSLLNILILEGMAGFSEIKIVTGLRRISLPWSRPDLRTWLFPILAGAGGLLTGIIVYRFAPEAGGHGTDEVIDSYYHKNGEIRLRVSLVKMIASAITIGSGGSGGKEGPIAQIGAGFGSFICTKIPYYQKYRREIMLAGMAAGISAIFRAPLAGAVFATEILHSDMHYNGKVLIPGIIAATVSYGVYALYFGFDPVFTIPEFSYQFSLVHLAPFTGIGIISALGAVFFVRLFYGTRDLFLRLPVRPYLKPMVGGLLTGVVAMRFSAAMGEGSFHMQMIIDGGIPLASLALLFFLKMLTTASSIGSGGSGGIFGPSLMIGASLGAVLGNLYTAVFPATPIPMVVFVLLGMVGFFAGAANAPISTVIMVSEMTDTFSLIVPFLWVAMFGYLFSQQWDIYENQIPLTQQVLDITDEDIPKHGS